MLSKKSLKKKRKLEEKKLKKQTIIPPQEILKSVRTYNRGVVGSKKIKIYKTDCLNKACAFIGNYLKNPNNISIKPSYRKTMPNLKKIKGIVIYWTSYECGLRETFAGAGGSVIILPLEK